jgi:hypothetical protein
MEMISSETFRKIPAEVGRAAAALLASLLEGEETVQQEGPQQHHGTLLLTVQVLGSLGELAAGSADRLAGLVISGNMAVCEAVADALGLIVGQGTAQEVLKAKLMLRSERRRNKATSRINRITGPEESLALLPYMDV